jgi:DNA-directed RNA polymerase specialized sigma24 family protein
MKDSKKIILIPLDSTELSDNNDFINQLDSELNADFFLSKCPPDIKTILELKIAGYKQKEIALKMGISITTLKRKMGSFRRQINIMN